ncbi:acyl dehydratase [Allocatelliglobosispora scoriae]|uniref:Acyl dehydratase n=1 Tax=Allocatelliglobosispora scoriae TaxID=643052 RepID=A0A841BTR2_9ACTN|nr:MaoC/PaaZ C-terminal domain-containing protein [Allocatelliglobosispora scoriae]MBB5870549.1 acyl dehydratase [Allocatelliglobosispora scoriae]
MFEVGQKLPVQVFQVTRADLIRYAGASGDFNPIHWSQRTAEGVGLPGVIAHGMLTMALAGRAVAAWAGRSDSLVDFGVRFTRPVPVPDTEEGTAVEFTAVVKQVADGVAKLDLTATCQGEKILAQAKAAVRI